uniref:Uncharacterized protein n=1 Tax=Helianthus annuus TaxID=4232 RepID=A0A251S407_HELAN
MKLGYGSTTIELLARFESIAQIATFKILNCNLMTLFLSNMGALKSFIWSVKFVTENMVKTRDGVKLMNYVESFA